MKDVLDAATAENIPIKKLGLRLMFAAEVFSEQFRDHVAQEAGIKNVYNDTLSIYGSADIGAMAFETGISVLIKRLAQKDESLRKALFGQTNKSPTIAQYNPYFIRFEEEKGGLFLTGRNTVPLVRYAIGDHGGVLSFDEIAERAQKSGYDLRAEAVRAGITDFAMLPFVYVYERSDFSTSLYGLQIYPEIVREAILTSPTITVLSGKFAMETKFNLAQDQYLEIHIEVKKGASADSRTKHGLAEAIFNHLRTKSSEFNELSKYMGKRARPKLHFHTAEDPRYFPPGVKQKWLVDKKKNHER